MEEPKIGDLEFLERSCAIFILRYLRAHPGSNKTMISSTEGQKVSSKIRTLEVLMNWGLVDAEQGRRREVLYSLTSAGEKVADHLDAIHAIMENQSKVGYSSDSAHYVNEEAIELVRNTNTQKDKHSRSGRPHGTSFSAARPEGLNRPPSIPRA